MRELREACAEVARRAGFVRVEEAALAPYAAELAAARDRSGELGGEPGDEPPGTREERAAFALSLDAINFGSGWFPTLRKDPGSSGYTTIAAAWTRHRDAHGPLTAAELATLSPAEVAEILDQDPGHELMELYALSLGDLGSRVLAAHDGSFSALVDAAGHSAVALAWALGGWPCFADRSFYRELAVPFLKRAQIAAADLARAGVVAWDDAAELTMFADNLVPHVLRIDGVLGFDPALEARIDAGELITHNSPEEIEIRACAVDAVERLVAATDGRTTAAMLDEQLWNRGRAPRYKARPRHRSRTTAY